MAEEEQVEQADQAEKQAEQPSSLLSKMMLPIGMGLVAIILALVVWKLVLAPRLNPQEPAEPDTSIAMPDDGGKISDTVVTVPFDQEYTHVVMDDPDIPASMLLYSVALECANPQTQALVERHKERFTAIINELHEFRKRDELNDPLVKKNIEKQILERCNNLLKRLQKKPDDEIRITAVMHLDFTIQDQ